MTADGWVEWESEGVARQVARLAAQSGADVVGVDLTWAQVTTAAERAGGPQYLLASATLR